MEQIELDICNWEQSADLARASICMCYVSLWSPYKDAVWAYICLNGEIGEEENYLLQIVKMGFQNLHGYLLLILEVL